MKTEPHARTIREFERLVDSAHFPCFAGPTAQRRKLVDHLFGGHMACPAHDQAMAEGIARFATGNKPEDTFRSLVVHVEGSEPVPEQVFEDLLFAKFRQISHG